MTISNLKKHIANLKEKPVTNCSKSVNNSRVIALGMHKLDLPPISSTLRKNKKPHKDYLKVTKEDADTLRGIVEHARDLEPSNNALYYTCKYTQQIQELLVCVNASCPSSQKDKVESQSKQTTNKPSLPSTRVISSTSASGSKSKSNTRKNRITQAASSNMKNKTVEDHPKSVMSSSNKKNHISMCNANTKHDVIDANSNFICYTCKDCLFYANHDKCVVAYLSDVNLRVKSKSVKSRRKEWKPTGKVFTSVGHRSSKSSSGTWTQTLKAYYEDVRISHQTLVARTPQQNGVVERWNRTLVEAARTMMIFLKAPLYLWAEVVAIACYTQNHSLIRKRHKKTPYELLHDRKLDLKYFYVFGALCYPTNDSENLVPATDALRPADLTGIPSSTFIDQDASFAIEPKNYKEALLESLWINAMQEEIHEFERLKVWELVPRPDYIMIINMKWITKVKQDEFGGSIPRRSNTDLDSEGQDSPLTKLINTVDGKFKFGIKIPDTMINDAIKQSAGYKYYKHKKNESKKGKAAEEPEEPHVSLIKSGREKGYMRFGNQEESRLKSLRQEMQAVRGEGSSAAHDKYYEFEDISATDSDAT
nr:putative ribonuclease H-like domain-containing protein [Tanacetum cinerariifolium]